MNEHPILFSTPMVQAILAGTKTQTRRIVKPQPPEDAHGFHFLDDKPEWIKRKINNTWGYFVDPELGSFPCDDSDKIKCPYGQPGDLLWVRETFQRNFSSHVSHAGYLYKTDLGHKDMNNRLWCYEKEGNFFDYYDRLFSWKPSIHMPKAAARIWMQIEDVRVERLQDITEEDAKAEGIKHSIWKKDKEDHFYVYPPKEKGKGLFCGPCRVDGSYVSKTSAFGSKAPAKFSFASLWNSVNGIGSWDTNPWVWVVKFKELSRTGRPEPATSNQ